MNSSHISPAGVQAGKATIGDVAAAAEVSIRTVSRVLNKSPKVNRATRERVERVIAHLGFRPSARARGLATGRSYLIGLVHNDPNAVVLDAAQRGIVLEASLLGYELVIHPTQPGKEDAAADVLDFAMRSRVDGLVIMAPVSGVDGLAQSLVAAGIPAVALSSVRRDGFGAVMISDERGGAASVARYLVGLGHRRIAFISGPKGVNSAEERQAGFVEALGAAGLAPVGLCAGDYSFEAGLAASEALLAQIPRPTAIFAANDVMAAAVLKVAARHGIHVPAQLSVVGFDGSMLARMLTPALTTVSRPIGDMAACATRLLIGTIEGRDCTVDTTFALSIIEGESAGPAPV